MSSDIIDLTKKFITKVQESGIDVSNAYIFGSYAKQLEKDWSDIDVCVVSPAFGKDYFGEIVALRKIALDIDSRIEPLAFTANDLDNPYSTLATEIKKYGIKIDIA